MTFFSILAASFVLIRDRAHSCAGAALDRRTTQTTVTQVTMALTTARANQMRGMFALVKMVANKDGHA